MAAVYMALQPMANGGNTMQNGGNTPGGDVEAHYKQEMLTAVKTGDEEKLQEALKHLPEKCVNYKFPHPVYATALHIAVKNNSADLVAKLLKAGADPNARDSLPQKYCPIHYAARKGNANILRALIKNNADVNSKEGEFGRSALHILANHWETNEESFKDALDVLLDCKKVRVDFTDTKGSSPLYMAATKRWEYMVRKLILKGANKESIEDDIRKYLPGLLETIDLSQVETPKRDFGDELYEALKDEDIEQFKRILNEMDEKSIASVIEENRGDYTLLCYACDNGLSDFVVELLKNGANPAYKDENDKTSPLLYATRNGYHKIVDMLIAGMKDRGDLEEGALNQSDGLKETPLHKVVKREYPAKKGDVDYYRCLQLLLDKKRYLDIDALDEFHNTPLHYAVLCDDQSFVRTLLLNGSHLGIRNKFGILAITRIQPSVLEEVLNDSIKYKNNLADKDFEIILHYSLLAPSKASQQPETECLRFLSGSRKHRRLLLHPIIDTFLSLKWQRIKKYYIINIIAYTLFVTFLTAYIILYHGTYIAPTSNTNGTETGSPSQDDGTDMLDANATSTVDNYGGNIIGKFILKALIALLALYIAVREGVQCFVSWRLYIWRFENWLEVSIVLLTAVLLFVPVDTDSQMSLSAWLILFSWTESILLFGRHPYLAVYITMFTTVTYNFLRFIVMFSFMIVAFSISFYLVFQMNEHFETYHQALLKTIAMTTGELEYTELPLSTLAFSSHLLFVVFVFLIVLVLMNLLNGLAVSDIQQIQQEAEILSYSSRVELILYIESVFFATPFKQILPGTITCCGSGAEDCYLADCCESPSPVRKLLNWMGRKTLMFHTCLRDHRISMYPNRRRERWHVCTCHKFHIKEAQIEAAKDVVLEKENTAADRRLSGLEDRLDLVMAAITSLTDKVDKHVLCPSPQ